MSLALLGLVFLVALARPRSATGTRSPTAETALLLARVPAHLEAPVPQSDKPVSDFVADYAPGLEDRVAEAEGPRGGSWPRSCTALRPKEREVILARAQGDRRAVALKAIGERWGGTRERVRQVEVMAMDAGRLTWTRTGATNTT